MQSGNKAKNIAIVAGGLILILGGVLIAFLINGGEELPQELKAPEKEFVYDDGEDYGRPLEYSSALLDAFHSDDSWFDYSVILNRISAFFAINYPEYTSFGLVKDSYKRLGDGESEEIEVKMVSNLGTIVKLEIKGIVEGSEETKVVLSNSIGEKVYETTVVWSEIEQMDGSEQEEPLEEEEEEYWGEEEDDWGEEGMRGEDVQ